MTQSTHLVQIPEPLPKPYNTFHPSWKNWVKQLNGRSVVCRALTGMMTGGPHIVKGYSIITDVEPEPGHDVSKWLPPEWLKPLNTQSITCNCPPRDLFNFGCRGH